MEYRMVALLITRTDLTSGELREAAARSKNARVTRRLLAMAMVLDGHSRQAAAEACAMDRQTLRDWVLRYNDCGLAGLLDHAHSGRRRWLTAEQEAEVDGWVETGPDLTKDGVVRWRRVDLRDRIKQHFGVVFHVRSVGKLLRRLNFRRMSVRPQHPESDAAEQEAFKKNFADLVRAAIPGSAAGKPIEFWWQDEARVGQQGTLTRIWARRGSRPRALRDHRFTSAYLFGAACPARGVGAAIVMPEVNVDAMNTHLAEISRNVSVGAIALLILDGAGWHSSPRLRVPENIVLLRLPPYAPELNSLENLWEYLRGNQLSHVVYETYEAVVDGCCNAWNALMRLPEVLTSITNRAYAQVKI
jgi:transposase